MEFLLKRPDGLVPPTCFTIVLTSEQITTGIKRISVRA